MKRTPASSIPTLLDPDHIERSLANSNELMRRVFAARGLDGQLRQETQHDRPDVLRLGSGRLFQGGR